MKERMIMEEIIIHDTRLVLIEGNITLEKTDAIVNAASSKLRGGGGVDGAIHQAGGPKILEECMKYQNCPTGETRVTSGGNLSAKYVIHTVGPIWSGGNKQESVLLSKCYSNAMKTADELKLTSISFPSISTGVYKYPVNQAAKIALKTVIDYIESTNTSLKEVRFVLYKERNYRAYSEALSEVRATRKAQ